MKKVLKIGLLCCCVLILAVQVFILINVYGDKNPAVGQKALGIPAISEKSTETDINVLAITDEPATAESESIDIINADVDDVDIEETTIPLNNGFYENTAAETTEPDEIDAPVNIPVELLSKDVPVFMYHTSSEYNPGGLTELYVKPSEFEKHVKYCTENGFTFCTFDDWDNLNNIEKPVFITFDDGYRENYTEIFPILQKYNAKITIFLIIDHIGAELTLDMIAEMNDSGLVKFESHTLKHPSLVSVSSNNARLTDELQTSKEKIEEITGKPVLALAYPNGEFNDIVKEKTAEFYLFGLRKDLGMHNTDYDPYEVRRIRISRSTSLEGFKRYSGG